MAPVPPVYFWQPWSLPHGTRLGVYDITVPIDAWFRTELRDYLRDNLLGPSARLGSYVDQGYVTTLVNQHLEHRANHGHRLWALLTLERWLALLPAWKARA